MPARRIGQTATFLPEIRATVVRSSGVSISTSSVGEVLRRLVREEQRQLVDELAEVCVVVSTSRSRPSLCWTSGCRDLEPSVASVDAHRVIVASSSRGSPGRAGARSQSARCGRERGEIGVVGRARRTMIAADLAEVVLVEAAHRRRRRADADARRDRRRPLVERHGVPVDGDPDLVRAAPPRPCPSTPSRRRSICSRCVSVPPVRTSRPPSISAAASASALRAPAPGTRGTPRSRRS